MSNYPYEISRGWDEDTAQRDGYIAWATSRRDNWNDVIVQGPQFTCSTPFDQEPNEGCKNFKDYSTIDLVELDPRYLPRTNYGPRGPVGRYRSALDRWNEQPYTNFWRVFWSRRIDTATERSLSAAVFPPGPTHVDAVHCLAMPKVRDSVVVCGLWSSIPFDYLVKVSGMADLRGNYVDRFPIILEHPAIPMVVLRTLRLNCLTLDYAPLWRDVYDPAFARDSWASPFRDWPRLGSSEPEWTVDVPLRSDYERRAALVELDALAAIILGLSAEQLILIHASQFGVLRKYEFTMWFDNLGSKIAKEFHAKGARQLSDDFKLLMAYNDGEPCGDLLERYEPPFFKVDREAEMRAAHAEFTERLGL